MKDTDETIRQQEIIVAKCKWREKVIVLWGMDVIDTLKAQGKEKFNVMRIHVQDQAELDRVSRRVRLVKLAMRNSKLAKVYDLVTEKLSTIPIAELGHGMIEVKIVGVGRAWISPSQLAVRTETGPICHPPIGDEQRKLIKERIMEPLSEVYPKTLNEWEDGFRRDINAEREIARWLVVVERFEAFANANCLDKAQRKAVFGLMLHCTLVPNRAAFWATVQRPQSLTQQQVEQVIAKFERNWVD